MTYNGYSSFRYIGDNSRLAFLFNGIMHKLASLRMLCTPDTFKQNKDIARFQDEMFANFCRYETYMHLVVMKLKEWQETIDEYFAEYQGSWKYYAASKRMKSIEEYGGDKTDYEEDGTIRTIGLKDEEYKPYSVLYDLDNDDWRDMVRDTMPADLNGLCSNLIANSRIDMAEGFRKAFWCDIKMYKQDNDGNMKPISLEEHDLDMISEQVSAEDDSTRLLAVVSSVQGIYHIIHVCKYDEDNTELLNSVSLASQALLDMNWEAMSSIMKRFADKYLKNEDNIHEREGS